MLEKIREAVSFLGAKISNPPLVGMITGTGLGPLTERVSIHLRLPFEKIPHFPKPTAIGHEGMFVAGTLAGKSIVALEGRFHLYEGYTPQEVTFPVRVMAGLGTSYLLISSAAGGLNPHYEKGSLMVLTDHINFTSHNPLVGPNLDEFGPRFPDMSAVYDPELIAVARKRALESQIPLQQGVYVAVLGPSLETPAETRFLRTIGADAVGMSTVHEAIAGVQCGMRILAIVVITNVNLPDCMAETTIEEVIEVANKSGATLSFLWEKIVESLPSETL